MTGICRRSRVGVLPARAVQLRQQSDPVSHSLQATELPSDAEDDQPLDQSVARGRDRRARNVSIWGIGDVRPLHNGDGRAVDSAQCNPILLVRAKWPLWSDYDTIGR